jgi:hypothetical protein
MELSTTIIFSKLDIFLKGFKKNGAVIWFVHLLTNLSKLGKKAPQYFTIFYPKKALIVLTTRAFTISKPYS